MLPSAGTVLTLPFANRSNRSAKLKKTGVLLWNSAALLINPNTSSTADPEKALDFILHQYEGGDLVKFRNALPQISRIPAPKPGFKKYEDGRLRPDGKPGFNTLSGKLDFFSDRAAKFGYPGLRFTSR